MELVQTTASATDPNSVGCVRDLLTSAAGGWHDLLMDQDDPEKRIAELEQQVAEQKRIADLERQLAEAKRAAAQADVSQPAPPPPSAPPPAGQSGPAVVHGGTWVSVDGSGFQRVDGSGAGSSAPSSTMERLAAALHAGTLSADQVRSRVSPEMADEILRLALLGSQPGREARTGLDGWPAAIRPAGRRFRLWPAALAAPLIALVVGGLIAIAIPPSTLWAGVVVCRSPNHLTFNSTYTWSTTGSTGTHTTYQCVSHASTYPISQHVIVGLQALLFALVVCGAVAIGALVRRASRNQWAPRVAMVLAVVVPLTAVFGYAASVASSGPRKLHTAQGLSDLLALTRDRFGDTMGYSLDVYPDYAVMCRLDPQDNRTPRPYIYRKGSWSDWAKSCSAIRTNVSDLSKFDAAEVAGKINNAAAALNIKDATTTLLTVESAAGGSLQLQIKLSDGEDASMELNPDGSIKALHPAS